MDYCEDQQTCLTASPNTGSIINNLLALLCDIKTAIRNVSKP